MTNNFHTIDVIILCGGLGTRIRPVLGDVPKVLAPIGNQTILEVTLKKLKKTGFGRVILATGFKKEQVKKCLAGHSSVVFSEEEELLGTGGALKNALRFVESQTFLAMNGDSLFDINFSNFFNFHKNSKNLLTIAVSEKTRKDVGSVDVDSKWKIMNFDEKKENVDFQKEFMSIGFYFFEKEAKNFFPKNNKFSLEYDFFPKIIKIKKCGAYFSEKPSLDIGTPERYFLWKSFLN